MEFQNILVDYFIKISKLSEPYEEFRNVLQTELEQHRNEPNYDKFEWQF